MDQELFLKIMYFFYILSFAAGYPAIILLAVYFVRQKKALILYILLYMLAFFTVILFQSLMLFKATSLSPLFQEMFIFIIKLAVASQVLSGCFFVFRILEKRLKAPTILLYSSVLILVFAFKIIQMAWGWTLSWETYLLKGIAYALALSLWILLAVHKKNIEYPELRAYANGIFIVLGLSIPLWILRDLLYAFVIDLKNPAGCAPVYLINILNIVFTIKFISRIHKDKPVKLTDAFRVTDFTDKEREIIRFLYRYLSNKDIADKAGISTQTVKNHLYNIYRKAGVQSRMEFIQWIKQQARYACDIESG